LRDTQEFLVVRSAPEIDPNVAASGISLLLGGVLVLRGRRKLGA
jgi:LPXTG-motif cell wall-anchored protein